MPSVNGFSGRNLIRMMPVLREQGYGKRFINIMDQKAQAAVLGGRGEMLSINWMWDEYWKEYGVPDNILDSMNTQNGECHNCHSPRFDTVEGESGAEYCSDECAEDSNDVRSEYSVDCDQCGQRFDSTEEGYYVDLLGTYACDTDCAWTQIFDSHEVFRYFSGHEEWDEEATVAAIKRNMNPSEINDTDSLDEACEIYGVRNLQCAECEEFMSKDAAIEIEDIGAVYDSPSCAWDGIRDYTTGATYAKLKVRFELEQLSDSGDLDDAIELIESED